MSLDCEATFRAMQDYLDRELSPEEMERVQAHLEGCGMCAEEYRFEASLLRHVGRCLQETEVPDDLFERIAVSLDRME